MHRKDQNTWDRHGLWIALVVLALIVLEVLKRRYASGELTHEQFEQMRHELEV
jgi:hypothetical protein